MFTLTVNESVLLEKIDNSQFTQPFNSANSVSIFKTFLFSESELKRDRWGLDGIGVSKSIKSIYGGIRITGWI